MTLPEVGGRLKLSPSKALALPLALTVALAPLLAFTSLHRTPRVSVPVIVVVIILAVWQAVLWQRARTEGRALTVEIALRKQHYLQACAQGSVLLYWGWYWRPVYEQIPLIIAQLVFAYVFDMLLTWSRRDVYVLGFAPFPVVFSINLFLWFKHDLFILQLLMVAVGLAAKELVTWTKNGRRAHIFNPSSLPLALVSIALIATSSTDLTYGQQIATTLEIPHHIALWIFCIALPGQLLFGVTTMTMSAVLTLYGWSHLYFLMTGTYFFIDSYIPAAVFLGMHLLFTDPSTSPRTEAGRAIFGMLYALSVAFLYWILEITGTPTFYDKLLAVPLLNLMIQSIDRFTARRRAVDVLRWWPAVGTQRRRLAYVIVWAIAFGLINKVEGVGDVRHARSVPLWQRACDEGRERACRVLATILTRGCVEGSPWACNELGILAAEGHGSSSPPAAVSFRRACERGQAAACDNGETYKAGQRVWQRAPPETVDYAILLQESASHDVRVPLALSLLDAACKEGWGMACYRAADAYAAPNGRPDDAQNVSKYLRRACELGVGEACGKLEGDPSKTGPVSRENVPPRHASGLFP